MKKNAKLLLYAWIIMFVVFNAVVLIFPDGFHKSTYSFWWGTGLVDLSLIGFLIGTLFAGKAANVKDDFLNLAIFQNARVFMPLCFIAGLVLMLIPVLPKWIAGVICIIIFAIFLIRLIKTVSAASIVSDMDAQIENKTAMIRNLTMDSNRLMAEADTAELKAVCKEITDALRYSDPMSSPVLYDVESEIMKCFGSFRAAVKNRDYAASKSIGKNLKCAIQHRNEICRAYK